MGDKARAYRNANTMDTNCYALSTIEKLTTGTSMTILNREALVMISTDEDGCYIKQGNGAVASDSDFWFPPNSMMTIKLVKGTTIAVYDGNLYTVVLE